MTNLDKIIGELTESGKKLCDDCLCAELQMKRRQIVNGECNVAKNRMMIIRVKGVCDLCNGFKLVNSIT